ncbi:class I SAM-dependent methyltransferase [Micromonospora sp. NBC_01796]|uniref:class I SAM-dependent methyltransferase n=1 Tax=Micromonospora sp. NBC_01796 TaxID=2975987 RepID=UPI002DDB198B|nr:class I SAM-dependent methyltransferase [Micromonospora sp. NBC_01796]WSA88875.1 class I SAM-dependent methyltransferase [Micromonospora sp. NBC_01796]
MADLDQALSFGAAAETYDRFRPTYPVDALAWAVDAPAPVRVVDLAAGTGILTRQLLGLGHRVVPVEPDGGMRAQLAVATPGTTALAGSAESMPLPDGDADVVITGQAYHWFDRDRAHAEAARVLCPGGRFAPIWNSRDESVAWVAALSRLLADFAGRTSVDTAPDLTTFGDDFEPLERAEFHHGTEHTADTLVGLVGTRSYYLTASEQRQHDLETAVRDLALHHPDLAGRDTFDLPYRTTVYRARRR